MRIGFIFNHMVPIKVARKRAMLMQNCHMFTLGKEKFSALQSSRVAAAKSPTTTGRKPIKMDCTVGVFMYFRNILLMSSININDGNTKANVAVALPTIAMSPV